MEFDSSLWPIFSFAGGPTQLPRTVLQKVKKTFMNYNQSGLNLMEIPSQSKEFDEIFQAACSELRTLYRLDPSEFDIYFGQAGATFIFEEICYNLLGKAETFSFCNTGHWSEKAIKEAKYIGNCKHCAIFLIS